MSVLLRILICAWIVACAPSAAHGAATGRAASGVGGLGGWGIPATLDDAGQVEGITHGVNARNEITGIVNTPTSVGTTLPAPPTHDAAGNLTYDGTYFYQYDAWNRLVQVNATHVAEPPAGGGGGGANEPAHPTLPPGVVVDGLIKQFVYDGLGRRIETRSPLGAGGGAGGTTPEGAAAWPNGANVPLRVERYTHDGIRRLTEMVEERSTPALQSGAAVGEIKSGLARADAASAYPGRAVTAVHLHREYIWGPGDGAAGVDELWAQYEGPSAGELAGLNAEAVAALTSAVRAVPYWTLQDAGGDVIALCDSGGPTVPTGVGSATAQTGRVLGQWIYDAYGAVLVMEEPEPGVSCPGMAVGHKGLFADRLDEGITTSGTDPPPPLIPFAATIYDARNRTYAPSLGRWMQRDPNATAQVLTALEWHGGPLYPEVADIAPAARHADSMSVYAYLASAPWESQDPLGLMSDRGLGLGGAAWDSAANALNTAFSGIVMAYSLNAMLRAQQANAALDYELIGDWSVPDEALSFHADNIASTQEAILGSFWNGMRRAAEPVMPGMPGMGDPNPLEGYFSGESGGESLDPETYINNECASRKRHGSAEHWETMRQEAIRVAKQPGTVLTSIQINRQLKGDRRRPDISYAVLDKKTNRQTTHIIEVTNTQSPKAAKEKWRYRPRGVAPVEVTTVPSKQKQPWGTPVRRVR